MYLNNIVSYVKEYGHLDFTQMAFNEVDALVLCQFIYLKLDDLVPHYEDKNEKPPIKLCHMVQVMDEERVFIDQRYEKDNRELLEVLLESLRFRGMGLHYHSNIVSILAETQFSAITIFLENGPNVIVYRGTDESIVGWKEDFNMFFCRPVVGQDLSTLYLKQVTEAVEGDFIVTGHSKGGNFAVYASMNVEESIQKRIQTVYSFDSPGFRPEILESVDFNKIKSKIQKYVPHSCIVGMVLQSKEPYRVVECSSKGFGQHNPYNWQTEGAHFKEKEDVAEGSKIFSETINQWLLGLSDEELYAFVEIWYEVAKAADVRDLLEFGKAPGRTLHRIRIAMRDLDAEKKEMGKNLLLSLLQLGRENSKKTGQKQKNNDRYLNEFLRFRIKKQKIKNKSKINI